MNGAAAIPLLVAASFRLIAAPDQPIPHVYVDEPLIFELESDTELRGDFRLTVLGGEDVIYSRDYSGIHLRAYTPRWQVVDELAAIRGLFTLQVSMGALPEQFSQTAAFCRVDRPPADPFPSILVHLDAFGSERLRAIRGAGLNQVHFIAESAESLAVLRLLAERGLKAAVELSHGFAGDIPAAMQGLLQFQDTVLRCEVPMPKDLEAIPERIEILGRQDLRFPVAAVVRSPEEFAAVIEADSEGRIDQIVCLLTPDGIEMLGEIRAIAEAYGRERYPVACRLLPSEPAEDAGSEASENEQPAQVKAESGPHGLVRRILEGWSYGAVDVVIGGRDIYAEDFFGESYPHLAAMAHRFQDMHYAGRYSPTGGIEVIVFRNGAEWLAAYWADDEESEAPFSFARGNEISLTDARNNVLDGPAPGDEGRYEVATAYLTPRYLGGRGGSILAAMARQMARDEAERISEDEGLLELLPEGVPEIIDQIADPEGEALSRRQFFNVMRAFPELEQAWHAESGEVNLYGPLMAGLGRLARYLCIIEEAGGEPFLEPLQDTLAQCRELQALYLTGSTSAGAPNERGDWLLNEIERLMKEARILAEDGRRIEADAVAVLAEWRARSLANTAKMVLPDEAGPNEEGGDD